ncbi:alpha/beta hydrolase-fold protein [Lutibacter sp.]|uniref:alpha/beta hydrolase-fold protein n=1 Tax=Lutibacter sp. TaxID=1925666 RepID=UPI002735ED2F|nr:alpha/beta hydrolase-fold protein [Lutibacter sp.]MDP3312750.1 alpha/beta hydrolase-fold protein [Lutibacter sp.]
MKKIYFSIVFILLFFTGGFGQQFKASYSSSVFNKAFTGNVVVYLSKENKEPKDGAVGIERFPCFSVAVQNVQPGQSVTIDDKANSFPTVLSDIERGDYYVQIVWDRNLGGRSIANSSGNLFNASEKITITKDFKKVFNIVAKEIVAEYPDFKETEYVKALKAPSALLTAFHGKAMTLEAAVILPKEYYTEPTRKFPVLFNVSGYGGDYHRLSGTTEPSKPIDSIAVIMVYLDGNCALGHSVYANSDNNGPVGDALTSEFIPLLEKTFRANGARLLTGHSSGGWTVLWLQTQYPKVFDGCWSSSPDPVDFRSFLKVNLFEDTNMFSDKDGNQRLVATVAGAFPWATMKTMYTMEHVIYRGEQMHSFDAVFSKKGSDGMPESICDSKTGAIDSSVFINWKKYDIALNLRDNWESLKPELDNKVRVSVGKQDNFLLNYPVYLLEKQMKELNSNFQFAYYPGDHFTINTPEYWKDGFGFLKQKYLEWIAKTEKK